MWESCLERIMEQMGIVIKLIALLVILACVVVSVAEATRRQ